MPNPIEQKINDDRRTYNASAAESIITRLLPPIQDAFDHIKEITEENLALRVGNRDRRERAQETLKDHKETLGKNEREKSLKGSNPDFEKILESNRRAVEKAQAALNKLSSGPGNESMTTAERLAKAITLYCTPGKTLAPDPLPKVKAFASRDAWEEAGEAILAKAADYQQQIEDIEESPPTLDEAKEKIRREIETIAGQHDPISVGPVTRATRSADGKMRIGRLRFPTNSNGDPSALAILFRVPEFASMIESSLFAQLEARKWDKGKTVAQRDSEIEKIEAAELQNYREYEAHLRWGEAKYGIKVPRPTLMSCLAILGAKHVDAPKTEMESKTSNTFDTEQTLRPRDLIETQARDKAAGISPTRERALAMLDEKAANAKNDW